NSCCALRKAICSESGKPMGAEGRIHGGGVFSIERPCNSAISRHGFRLAECSQPQPRSIAHPERSLIVHARPPSRGRASTTRQLIRASTIRRAAAIPAAPAPTTTTSVSLLLVTLFCRFELGTAFARAAAVLFPACPLIRVQLQLLATFQVAAMALRPVRAPCPADSAKRSGTSAR